jgi:hypothetical protein
VAVSSKAICYTHGTESYPSVVIQNAFLLLASNEICLCSWLCSWRYGEIKYHIARNPIKWFELRVERRLILQHRDKLQFVFLNSHYRQFGEEVFRDGREYDLHDQGRLRGCYLRNFLLLLALLKFNDLFLLILANQMPKPSQRWLELGMRGVRYWCIDKNLLLMPDNYFFNGLL